MAELSVICATVNEWPQVAFTIRNVYEELRDRVDFEIILVDNYCEEVKKQGREKDRTFDYFHSMMKGWKWLKVIPYTEKLSHWNSKRVGIENSTGKFIWFSDAHIIVSRDALYQQFCYYKDFHQELDGVLHLPVTYHVMEYHKLMYKLEVIRNQSWVHYSFTPYREISNGAPMDKAFKQPCMTTDGMMISKELYDYIGGFPKTLGIWGGGENFMNFTLAVLGKNVWIMKGNSLNHHGDRRGYAYNYDDLYRNRLTACYLYAGQAFAENFTAHYKGSQEHLRRLMREVVPHLEEQRKMIESKQQKDIMDWCTEWGK